MPVVNHEGILSVFLITWFMARVKSPCIGVRCLPIACLFDNLTQFFVGNIFPLCDRHSWIFFSLSAQAALLCCVRISKIFPQNVYTSSTAGG